MVRVIGLALLTVGTFFLILDALHRHPGIIPCVLAIVVGIVLVAITELSGRIP